MRKATPVLSFRGLARGVESDLRHVVRGRCAVIQRKRGSSSNRCLASRIASHRSFLLLLREANSLDGTGDIHAIGYISTLLPRKATLPLQSCSLLRTPRMTDRTNEHPRPNLQSDSTSRARPAGTTVGPTCFWRFAHLLRVGKLTSAAFWSRLSCVRMVVVVNVFAY